jgi:ABC-type phosphate transport system substrate-binding protein
MPPRQLFLAAFTVAAALAVVAFINASRPGATTAAAVLRRRRLEAETEADPPDTFAGAAFVAPVTKEICAEGTKRTYVAWKKVRGRLFQLSFTCQLCWTTGTSETSPDHELLSVLRC